MEINGILVDGVIVEKDVARATFESEVREKKEVALVETIVGNVFKTRVLNTLFLVDFVQVSPIPARSLQKLRIKYYQELLVTDASASYTFTLTANSVIDSLHYEVITMPFCLTVQSGISH